MSQPIDKMTPFFQRLSLRIKRLKPAIDQIGMELTSEIQLNFRRGVNPYGKKHEPLSALTKMLRRGNGDGQPLRDTGRLSRSIVYQGNDDTVTIGTNYKKEAVLAHQFGAVIEPKNGGALFLGRIGGRAAFAARVTIPKREIFPVKELPNSWREIAKRAIATHVGGAA